MTGFEPFLKYPINPTMEVVNRLSDREINGYKIHGKILTVDFSQSGQQLLDEINQLEPDAAISLGLSGGRYKITPERIAVNCNDGPPDNKGEKLDGEAIFSDGEDGYFSTLPIKKMVNELMANGFPADISNTAGTYLCNNVMYHGLYDVIKKGTLIPTGFIHIPASHELAIKHGKVPSWSQTDLNRAIELCVECL